MITITGTTLLVVAAIGGVCWIFTAINRGKQAHDAIKTRSSRKSNQRKWEKPER